MSDDKSIYDKLLGACFPVAQDLMWEENTVPLEKLPEQIAELQEMTEKLIEIANGWYFKVESLPNGDDILVSAINYLQLQAIPPLRGNYAWFSYSLSTLLEIINPNVIMRKEQVPFLLCLQKGIISSIGDAFESSDEDNSGENI